MVTNRMAQSVFKALLVILVLSIGIGPLATADTYNFHFTKPKKKTKKSVTVTPQGSNIPEQVVEDSDEAPESDDAEEEVAPPKKEKKAIKSSDDRAIIINNYIGDTAAKPVSPPAPAPAPAPVTTAPVTPPATSKEEVRAPRASYDDNRFRFGLAASYFPRKSIKEHDWFNFKSTDGNYTAYGGTFSFGWVPSSIFTMNVYLGGSYAGARDQTMYLVGLDGELYPFANSSSREVSGLELAVLLGGTTHFGTDGNVLALHAGSRLNINLTGKMGLTAVARLSENYLMLEAGFITRF